MSRFGTPTIRFRGDPGGKGGIRRVEGVSKDDRSGPPGTPGQFVLGGVGPEGAKTKLWRRFDVM